MKYSATLNEIFDNLNNGYIYATWAENVRFPMYWTRLEKVTGRNGKPLIYWNAAGSSHDGFTRSELKWVIETIFRTTPEQFVKQHDCITEYERVHAIHNGVSCENVDNGYSGEFYNMGV